MKIIVSESQYKVLMEQQSKPIPIDLYKDPDAVEKYCKPIKVRKEIIDSKIPLALEYLSERIDKRVQDVINEFPETKPFKKKFDKILVKIRPILESIVTKSLYSNFGYINYDPNIDAKRALDIIYSEILSELEDYKLIAKALITKKNAKHVKGQMISGIDRYSRIVETALKLPFNLFTIQIRSTQMKESPLCKNVLVVVDESLNKLKPNEQYHPKFPVFEKNEPFVDFDRLITPYIPKLNQIIDSFV